MTSAKRSKRGRSRNKRWDNTTSNSVMRTPKQSRSKSSRKRTNTPKARLRGPKCSIFC